MEAHIWDEQAYYIHVCIPQIARCVMVARAQPPTPPTTHTVSHLSHSPMPATGRCFSPVINAPQMTTSYHI